MGGPAAPHRSARISQNSVPVVSPPGLYGDRCLPSISPSLFAISKLSHFARDRVSALACCYRRQINYANHAQFYASVFFVPKTELADAPDRSARFVGGGGDFRPARQSADHPHSAPADARPARRDCDQIPQTSRFV